MLLNHNSSQKLCEAKVWLEGAWQGLGLGLQASALLLPVWLKPVAIHKCYCWVSWPNCSSVTFLLLSSIPNFPTSLPYFLDVTCNYIFSFQAWLSMTHAPLLACLRQVRCAASSPLSNLLLWKIADISHRPCSASICRGQEVRMTLQFR